MKEIIGSIVVATCTAFAATSVLACEPMHGGVFGEKIFAQMDANKDGAVSQKEFDAFQAQHFKEMDANHDGKVTKEEFQAAHPAMLGHDGEEHHRGEAFVSKRFDAADTNHDGALSREEAKNMPMILQHFDEIDVNKDGKVTEDELKKMMEGIHSKDDTPPAK